MQCGLAKNYNGVWEVRQLKPKLQEIIKKYPMHFAGTAVVGAAGSAAVGSAAVDN